MFHRQPLIPVTALLMVALFSSCRRESVTEITSTATAAPVAAAKTYPVDIGYLRIGSDLPFFVGRDAGIFKKHGLAVTEHRFADSNQAGDALSQGGVDVTDIIGSSVVLKDAIDHPGALKIIIVAAAGPASDIHQLVATPTANVKTVKDLAGKKLAVFPGTQMRVYAQLFLSKFLSPEQVAGVQLVPLSPPQQVGAFKDKQVDAVLALEPTGTELVLHHGGVKVASNVLFESITKPQPFVTSFAVVRSEWAQQNPEAAAALVTAYREIVEYIRTRPQETRAIMAKALGLQQDVAERSSIYDYAAVPQADAPSVDAMIDLLLREKVIPKDIEAAALLFAPPPQ